MSEEPLLLGLLHSNSTILNTIASVCFGFDFDFCLNCAVLGFRWLRLVVVVVVVVLGFG